MIALTGWRPGRTWSLLLAGLGAQAVADISYTLQSTNGVVPAGSWIDPIYLISAVFLGAVVWRPTAASIPPSGRIDDRRELMVPALFAAVMIGLFAIQYFSATSGLSTALWAATMIAVIARLAASVKENKELLEQVRTDSLTGLGNRGRMQVDLEAHCARTGDQGPAALFLFDLNGFKLYNDTFGHPAGDVLLTRLGNALGEAVGEDGVAYRVGGDEFCVLLTCEEERFDTVAGKAAQALTVSERGVEVASSWGAVKIPCEADAPSEALQLADVRMYAQKESRRDARASSAAADAAIAPADAPADAPAA